MPITDKVLSADVTKKGYAVPYFLPGNISLSGDSIVVSYSGYPSAELSASENSIWTDTFTVPANQVHELNAAVIALQENLIRARIDELNTPAVIEPTLEDRIDELNTPAVIEPTPEV